MLSNQARRNPGNVISVLWIFATFNILFRDIHELTTASAIAEISSGYVNGNPITEEVLFAAAFGVVFYLLALPISYVLHPKLARPANLALPILATLGVILGQPSDLDDVVFASVEVFTFATILLIAYRWDTSNASARKASHV